MSKPQPSIQIIFDLMTKMDKKLDLMEGRCQTLADKLDDVILSHFDMKSEIKGIKRRLDEIDMHVVSTKRSK